MQFRYFIISLLTILTVGTLSAQSLRLPASHNNLHNDLIANQRPMSSVTKDMAAKRIADERAQMYDDDVFDDFWNSDRVNPYGKDFEIPDVKDIDVSEYVAPTRGTVTSNYGWRARFGRMHRGIDIGLKVGDTIRAAFDGKIRVTRYEGRGYGYFVVIRHDNGLETLYGHLSRFLVKPDQYVRAGDPIALGGNTGRSTGPHLHFETRYCGLAINPAAIFDFDNYVAHKDIFTFNKATYEKGQNYAPVRKYKKGKSSKALAKKSSKKKSKKRSRR